MFKEKDFQKRPMPKVIKENVNVNSGTDGFYYADYNVVDNIIYNFKPVWDGEKDTGSFLYQISKNYDIIFQIIMSHELQHWFNEQIDTEKLGFSYMDYLSFHTINEISGFSNETYVAFEKYNIKKDWRYLLTLHSETKSRFKGINLSKQDADLVINDSFNTMKENDYLEIIPEMALRSIENDFKNSKNKEQFVKSLKQDSFNRVTQDMVAKYMLNLNFSKAAIKVKNFPMPQVIGWIETMNISEYSKNIFDIINNTRS